MKKILKPQYAFVLLAIIFGFVLMFFTPPFQSPDEPWHFAKAFSVSQGHLFSKKADNISGDYLPEALLKFEKRYKVIYFDTSQRISFDEIEHTKNILLQKDKKAFVNQKYQAMYTPLAYLPQAVGIFVSKIFTDSVYWLMIGAKSFLLLFYVLMGYFSIKSIPFGKWLCAMILLMPMSLSLGASVSADGVLIAVSVLFFSKVLEYSYQKQVLGKKQLASLCAFAAALALIKQSFLISLFVLFIPREKFSGKYFAKIACVLLPAFVLSVLFSKVGYDIFVPLNGSNPAEQLRFIIAHPFVYALTLLKTLAAYFQMLIYSTIGILGWLDVFMFPFMYWLYGILIFLNAFFQPDCECEKINVSLFQKVLLPLLVVINFVVICSIIYVSWAVPYLISPFEGLQGRYFIPLLLPVFTALFLIFKDNIRLNLPQKFVRVNLCVVVLAYLNICFGIFIRYYAAF